MSWEKGLDISQVQEIRGAAHVFMGVGAVRKIGDIARRLKAEGVDKVLVMTGRSAYEKSGAWKFISEGLAQNGVKHVLFNKVRPNPEARDVDEAAALGREAGVRAVIGIGGGSPIDAAKSVAVMLEYPEKTCKMLYEMEFAPTRALPVVAVNLTHGTGSEANRVAVISIPEEHYKPAVAYDCLYPRYSIDDPVLMTTLPKKQTAYVSVDAVNHVIEASTSKIRNPLAVTLARETVALVGKHLPDVLENPHDLHGRYYLTYASMIAGLAFDNSMLHLTHALEHPLSGLKPEVSHGLGLSVLLPAVIRAIYPKTADILAEVLRPIVPHLQGRSNDAETAASGVKTWLASVGITETLTDIGFQKNDIPQLADLCFKTPGLPGMLALVPVEADRTLVERIFTESL